MNPLILAAGLVLGAEEQQVEKKVEPAKTVAVADAAPKLDGKWLIVYAEEGGRRNNSWETQVATVSGETLSYEAGGKKYSLQMKFGPNQTLKATVSGSEGKDKAAQSGVYIAGQDYLCISLNPEGAEKGKEAAATATKGADDKGTSSGSFILIFRKQR
jgi:hypothetical protein